MSKTLIHKKKTPPYGGKTFVPKRALPIPPKREPLDSSPTPVLSLGYRDLSAKFLLLASRFDSHALVLSKNLQSLDIEGSKECRRIADNIRHIAKRVQGWPNMKLSNAALAAEKSWAAEQFLNFVVTYQEIVGERPSLG